MSWNTADISDADPQAASLFELDFRSYGGRRNFCGPCVTLKVHEDHREGVKLFNTPRRIALPGGTMSVKAVLNGQAGAIVYGAIRDTEELAALDIGVRALCTVSRKSPSPTEHQFNVPVHFGGATFNPGDWVYADWDGVLARRNPYVAPEIKANMDEYR